MSCYKEMIVEAWPWLGLCSDEFSGEDGASTCLMRNANRWINAYLQALGQVAVMQIVYTMGIWTSNY